MECTNYCDSCGNCTKCGNCCAATLPLTRKEEKRIMSPYTIENKKSSFLPLIIGISVVLVIIIIILIIV